MFRKFALSLAAVLTLGTTFSLATAPAVAYDRTQGGVIPGSQDDQRFVYGRGWVPNVRTVQVPRHHGGHYGHRRRAPTIRSFVVPRGQVLVPTGIFCMRNVRTREIQC